MGDLTIEATRPPAEGDPEKAVRIIVNARPHDWSAHEISFDQVVKLAYPVPPSGDPMYTVTYRKGPGPKPEGTMVEGSVVRVKEGEIFNVSATDKS